MSKRAKAQQAAIRRMTLQMLREVREQVPGCATRADLVCFIPKCLVSCGHPAMARRFAERNPK